MEAEQLREVSRRLERRRVEKAKMEDGERAVQGRGEDEEAEEQEEEEEEEEEPPALVFGDGAHAEGVVEAAARVTGADEHYDTEEDEEDKKHEADGDAFANSAEEESENESVGERLRDFPSTHSDASSLAIPGYGDTVENLQLILAMAAERAAQREAAGGGEGGP